MKPRQNQTAWDALREHQAQRVVKRLEEREAALKRRIAEDRELRRRVEGQLQKNLSPFQKLADLFRKRKDDDG